MNNLNQQRPEEMERYGPIDVWAEELHISNTSLARQLREAPSVLSKDRRNRVRLAYAESVVRAACVELLRDLPAVDDTGFLVRETIRYGTIMAWCADLDISETEMRRELEHVEALKGRTSTNRIVSLYAEAIVRETFLKLKAMPSANDAGFLIADAKRYGSLKAWAAELGIARDALVERLKDAPQLRGRIASGHTAIFYEASVVQELCGDLQGLPRADDQGYVLRENVRYASVSVWGPVVGISPASLKERLKGCEGIPCLPTSGGITAFYAETDIRRCCADLLQADLPTAGDDGFFEKDGVRYGTIHAWAVLFKEHTSETGVRGRLLGLTALQGKNRRGKISLFYPEGPVREACAEFFLDMPKADASGFFTHNDIVHGTTKAWGSALGFSEKAIQTRLDTSRAIRGKTASGVFAPYYPEDHVRAACHDLIAVELLKADEKGFIVKEDVHYATIHRWCQEFNVDNGTMRKRFMGIGGLEAMTSHNHKATFYSEQQFRELCADLLSPLS